MQQHVTVVYYTTFGSIEAFHATHINHKDLQGVFYDHDVHTVKQITIETHSIDNRTFETIFSEKDIQEFLKKWKINF